MAWGFLDWVRGRPYRPKPDELAPAAALSPRKLRATALRLLDDKRAYDAYKLLDAHRERARPILEGMLREDVRFRSMAREVRGWCRPTFDVVLSILFEWDSDVAVDEAMKLAESPDPGRRAVAARLLASTGDARFAATLARLARDPNDDVRLAVGRGIDQVLGYGDRRELDDALALALYDYMRECALRTDKGPGNRFGAKLEASIR